ncbi:hypothetical protein AVEN_203359-1 [Araneus ventricosus]|uniref:Uncharacterized protein n=1 Tax=Araneus ventricosus TaxID=182803 RepID=A0A4Y2W2V3_ARAVE|nr:hypothetical protein AVEN_105395-1 [Araneus ventricosus]GBO31201.1 hypothetical protein AVEN_96284-1 [Araneus ventricosus]GBO31202.1 hypothetical protein AVEN_11866-1 [Araneus ventricosus]GBO31206.1 hypothetical protein AVEN_203359-1 [Araneus ventricosus]
MTKCDGIARKLGEDESQVSIATHLKSRKRRAIAFHLFSDLRVATGRKVSRFPEGYMRTVTFCVTLASVQRREFSMVQRTTILYQRSMGNLLFTDRSTDLTDHSRQKFKSLTILDDKDRPHKVDLVDKFLESENILWMYWEEKL